MQNENQKNHQEVDTRRFYAVLGVATGTSVEQLKERYRSLLIHARAGIACGRTDSLKLQTLRQAYLALCSADEPRAV